MLRRSRQDRPRRKTKTETPTDTPVDMSSNYHSLEPFPLFVDSARPSSPNYFASSKMGAIALLEPASSASSSFRARIAVPAVPAKVTNYLHLRYYQYEVTFGLYMLTMREKLVLNTIILGILAALIYGICFGLQPFVVRIVCRFVWYLTGTFRGVEEICT